jgi:hypothetical protein
MGLLAGDTVEVAGKLGGEISAPAENGAGRTLLARRTTGL